ncbi:hypothetical protein GPNCGGLF_LOCUS322 [Methylorubrum aminovorans]
MVRRNVNKTSVIDPGTYQLMPYATPASEIVAAGDISENGRGLTVTIEGAHRETDAPLVSWTGEAVDRGRYLATEPLAQLVFGSVTVKARVAP